MVARGEGMTRVADQPRKLGAVGPAIALLALSVVDWTGNFLAAFAITSAVCLAGSMAWTLGIGRTEQVTWADKPRLMRAAGANAA